MLVNLLATVGNMGGKGSVGDTLGNFAKSRIQSKNYAAMLQKILGGMPPGAEMKAAAGPDGKMTFTMPTASVTENQHLPGFSANAESNDAMSQILAGNGTMAPTTVGGVNTPAPVNNTGMNPANPVGGNAGGGFVNPSSSPQNISGVNLAGLNLEGLTPQEITQALQLQQGQQHINLSAEGMGINRENLGISKADLAMRQEAKPLEQLMRAAQIRHLMAQSGHLESGGENKTAEIKNYEYAKGQGFKGTFDEWKNITESASIKDYQYAVKNGYAGSFEKWKTDMAQAGATRIENKIQTKQEMNKLEGESYMADPKNLNNDLSKHLNSEEVKNEIFSAGSDAMLKAKGSGVKDKAALNEADRVGTSVAKFKANAGFIENQIKGGGGTIQSATVSKDKRSITWTVKWPSGNTTTVTKDIPGIVDYLNRNKK